MWRVKWNFYLTLQDGLLLCCQSRSSKYFFEIWSFLLIIIIVMLLFTSGLLPYCHHDIIVIVSLLKKLYSYYNYLQWYYIHSVKPHFESIFYFSTLSFTATSWAGPGKAKAFGDKSQFQQCTQRILQGTSVSENIGHICGLKKLWNIWEFFVYLRWGKNIKLYS